MEPMSVGRADVCCTINNLTNEIYVIGGHRSQVDTQLCEKLDIIKNKWYPLPILNEAKNSASALIVNNTHCYVFGGEAGTINDVDLTYQSVSIEVLELNPKSKERFFWDLLNVRLHIPLWGIGALELS